MSDSLPQACIEADRQLVAFACDDAGDVPPSVRAHLESCPRCSAELRALRRTRETFRQLPLEEPSSALDDGIFAALDAHFAEPAAPVAPDRGAQVVSLAARRPRRWLGPALAAAASLVVVAGTAWYLSLRSPDASPALATASAPRASLVATGEKNAEAAKPLVAMNEPASPASVAGDLAAPRVVTEKTDKASPEEHEPEAVEMQSAKKGAQPHPTAMFGSAAADMRREVPPPAKPAPAHAALEPALSLFASSGGAGGRASAGPAPVQKQKPAAAVALNDSFAADRAEAPLEQQVNLRAGAGAAVALPAAPPPPPPEEDKAAVAAPTAQAAPALAALTPAPAAAAPRRQLESEEAAADQQREQTLMRERAQAKASKEESMEGAEGAEATPRPPAPLWERDLDHARSAAKNGDHQAAADFYARVLRLQFLPSNIEEEAMSGRVHELLALGRLDEAQAAAEVLATRHPKSAALRDVARTRANMAPAAPAPAAEAPPPAALPAAMDGK